MLRVLGIGFAPFLMTGHTVAAPVEQLEVKGSLGLLRLLTTTRLFWTEQLMMRYKPALLACKPTRLPLGRKGFKQWPLAPDSKYALEALTLDKMVTLYFDGSPRAAIGAFIFGRWVMGAKANVKTRHGAGVNIPRQQSDCCGYVCHRTPSPQRQHGLLGASFLQPESRSPQCTLALNWYILVDQREGFGFSQSQRNYLFKFW